jgi:hypothetical protein
MHLVTAALLAALLGKGQRGGLPSFPGVIEVAHTLPGRLRLRAPILVGQRKAAMQLQGSIGRLEGVRVVDVSAVSGSILIKFSPEKVTADMMQGAAVRLLGLEKDIERPPVSTLGAGLRKGGEALNHAIYEQTGGMIDLWTAVTMLLVVAGIRQLAAGNQFGWPLLWWAYRSMSPPGSFRQP